MADRQNGFALPADGEFVRSPPADRDAVAGPGPIARSPVDGAAGPVQAPRRSASGEEIGNHPVFALSERVLLEYEDGGDDVVVIDGRLGTICTSNAAASLLLPLLKKGATAGELAALLSSRFSIQDRDAREDVQVFLDQLSMMGFVGSRPAGRDPKQSQAGA